MEYIKRCKVCGKIWCYTDADLSNDTINNVNSALHAIGGIASAFGGTVFHNQYFADRMENDERKRVNRNQCPECRSLDSETISAEELENYKIQESFSKAQVSINSNATTESLLTRAKLLLEDKDWANANAYCDNVLDTEPENGMAYLYKLMAELRVQHQEELKDKSEPFEGKANYQKVMRYADEPLKRTLSGYIEYIKDRNENERLQTIYVDGSNRMGSAATEADFKTAAEIFGTIPAYKDAVALQRICLEKAEQARIETEKKEAAIKAKKTRNTIIIAIVLIIAAVAGFFAYSSSQKTAEYNEAVEEAECYDLMSMVFADEYLEYFWTIDDFTRLGDYKDSATRAEAMREEAYKTIFACLDEGAGDYRVGYCVAAYKISEELGDYKDCPELTNQIKEEYDRFYAVYSAEEITEEVIEATKSVIAENEYVKTDELSNSLYFFETLHNVEWECVSGDNRTLSMANKDSEKRKNTWPTITTEVSEKGGWNGFSCITFRHGEQGLMIGATNNSKCGYDKNTLACEWVETAFGGADYTVNLTEQGTLHIVAERNDGVIFECEYKRIG